MPRRLLALLLAPLLAPAALAAQAGPEGFEPIRFGDPAAPLVPAELFPGARHDPAVPTPDELLGYPVGTRPARHADVVACFRRWAEVSPRLALAVYGRTFEGRELVVATVTSEANHARLDAILADLGRLADPRGLAPAEGQRLVRATPASAWLGYSIHGDELSGVDAALVVAHHLIASTDDDTAALLDRLVISIDPDMNPDGRERYVAQLEQTAGYVGNRDHASMQRGRWPYGRGNHYLFDMNRDWIAGIAPETRGRWRAARRVHPQLFVDAHEMGALDTYLFYPQARAHNPELPATLDAWHRAFAADQAAAFDAQGWGYYTREWADAWGPFYSDAWGSLSGAVGILYEQARSGGQPVQRASGEVKGYRASVHGQAVSSLANLATLAANREAVLADYLAHKRANVEPDDAAGRRWFACLRGRNADRERELLRILLEQAIEVHVAREPVTGVGAVGALAGAGDALERLELPAGTLLVPAAQPLAPLVRTYLGFDPRMERADLERERAELEQKHRSRIYDVTAWDLPHALGLDAYWLDALEDARPAALGEPLRELPEREAGLTGDPDGAYAWVVDGDDDAALRFAAQAMELGVQVHLGDEPFRSAGRSFPRGSLLVRRHENGPGVAERVAQAAQRAGARVVRTASGRSPDDGPDLGGQHFHLLHRPRVALVANAPVRTDAFGHLWHLLDHELRLPCSMIEAQYLGAYDLRRFNVLVLPPAGGLVRAILAEHAEALDDWVRAGGTLIACGASAAALADAELGLSGVVLRRDALDELDAYREQAQRERAARSVEVDEALVWGDAAAPAPAATVPPPAPEGDALARRDRWMRRFAPHGAFVRGLADPHHWITSGFAGELPVFVQDDHVLLARAPVRTAVRLAGADDLRLAGLVWPEARERLADSAWLTVERRGNGQVVLFASQPGFRGYFRCTARLFANAVVLGPGAGASQAVGW